MKLLADGRIPLLARIPYSPLEGQVAIPLFNQVIDDLTLKHHLTPGPDLYKHFLEHPEQLVDELHPNAAGNRAINRLWATAVDGLYPYPAN